MHFPHDAFPAQHRWSWSMWVDSSRLRRQMAHSPSCSDHILWKSSSVIPYFCTT